MSTPTSKLNQPREGARSRLLGAAKRTIGDLAYRSIVGRYLVLPLARGGRRHFARTGSTPHYAFSAMRRLYGNVDPTLFASFASEVASIPAAAPRDVPGLAEQEVDSLVQCLRKDGIARLARPLPGDVCDALEQVARSAECEIVGSANATARGKFDDVTTSGIRYDVPERDLIGAAVVQRLLADQSLIEVARRYLESEPLQDLIAMWWSRAAEGGPSSRAAQQFHFDLDRVRFLKFFVFLTDVTEATGPHVLVRGSHQAAMPARFRREGRYSDDVVHSAFDEAVEVVTGPRGTAFFADTRALHKGMHLREGHRLIFQLEWSSSLFGAPYTKVPLPPPIPELRSTMTDMPHVFTRFIAPVRD